MIDVLRRGAVTENGLDLLVTGLGRPVSALGGELDAVASGASVFKAVRGEYGSGETFFTHARRLNSLPGTTPSVISPRQARVWGKPHVVILPGVAL